MINRIERRAGEMLPQGRVFVLTLGQNEVWRNLRTGELILHPYPRALARDTELSVHFMTVQENLDQLEEIRDTIMARIPDAQIILGVCPIALRRTYQDMDAVQGNNVSKYTLYVAASEFVTRYENMHYFAGFDVVRYHFPGYEAYKDDGRHLKDDGVDTFLDLFLSSFCTERMQRAVLLLKQWTAGFPDGDNILAELKGLGYPRSLLDVKKADLAVAHGRFADAAATLASVKEADESPAIQFNLGLLGGAGGDREEMRRRMERTRTLLDDLDSLAFAGASRANKVLFGSNHLKFQDNFCSVRKRVLAMMHREAGEYLAGKPLPGIPERLAYVGADAEGRQVVTQLVLLHDLAAYGAFRDHPAYSPNAVVVTPSLLLANVLEREGRPFLEIWDYLKGDDIRRAHSECKRLAAAWWLSLIHI
eukprot:TRINITY_DN3930_c0_g1_i3.p3 TRINITY_DN3930_c0_g1~~TRINITY_DN3930_c0_g1_i3.p3  ORF type:complete len:420 (-),score=171.59 TRINITY_DN3930_c0_g1_i3:101-1360(-)